MNPLDLTPRSEPLRRARSAERRHRTAAAEHRAMNRFTFRNEPPLDFAMAANRQRDADGAGRRCSRSWADTIRW